jgi:hypothetical protein
MRKVFSRIALLGFSLLWLTPSYICAMDSGRCPLMSSMQSSAKECTSSCCQSEKSHKHSAPCHSNSACGTLQSAVTSEALVITPSLISHPLFVLQLEANAPAGIRIVSSEGIRPPARGHPVQDFFSNSSNLSPPSLA